MATESVSFRITRNTEDLAQTIHALSQRLVMLEQRLEAMQLHLDHRLAEQAEPEPEALASLDNVERLLHDCRCLLGLDGSDGGAVLEQPGAQEPEEVLTETISGGEIKPEDEETKPSDLSDDGFDFQHGGHEPEDRGFGPLGESFSQAA